MSNPWVVATATVVIIALSAFFVAVEFALLAAKRHRLEDAAAESRAARAALRSSTELTVLLAGSQLGITVCTLALGAITKPAVHHWITPVVSDLGAPYWVADVVGFVLALVVVTFLHLVVGEMAPKSWAIAHPERSATMLALPMRAFMVPTRPILVALNSAANWCLRRVGVEPVESVGSGQNPDDLRHLVEHSASVGALELAYSAQLSGALDLRRLTVADLVAGRTAPVTVSVAATAGDVRRVAHETGHLRLLVRARGAVAPTGVVHVRDTLLLDDDAPVAELVTPVFELEASTPLHTALTRMRETSTHLAVVRTAERGTAVVTLADVLAHLFPRTTAAAQGGASSPVPGGR
ncbi:Hemolysin, contains CBS domains [Georgenia satyanarayanai]|uniref:Hemolysin, contains CBS domains n=1 Tax=Georgenia satyanarayanai TaxID=860221 RepID=A0A2Y9AQM0_9MICO|nr:CNNM domain-containing protein [Georgenia satyanarayanai]PYF97270.1 CBS domain containing-hemolysin-like protein [Georgenia satyanarayanai]SSA46356.1 Hemolysin, contains CBS domains [Georgenia satyanarayanai]